MVQFKARREKEQLLWRSKDKLRKINVIVTDDISLRQKIKADDAEIDPQITTTLLSRQQNLNDKKSIPISPKKKQKSKPSAEELLFADFF